MMLQHHSSHSSGRSSLAAGLRMLDVNGCDGSVLHGSKWCRFTSHIFMLSPQQPCQFLPMTEKSFLNRGERLFFNQHGSLNVPIEHHPTIRYMVHNGYYKVMSNIPKMGQLPTPDQWPAIFMWKVYHGYLQLHLTRPMGIIIPSQTKHVHQTESHSSYVYIHTYIYIYINKYIYIYISYIYVCIYI